MALALTQLATVNAELASIAPFSNFRIASRAGSRPLGHSLSSGGFGLRPAGGGVGARVTKSPSL